MKRTIIVLMTLMLAALPLMAQEETVFGTEEVTHGGFGGPVMKVTTINGKAAILAGGRGGWIINHTFILGLGGYGVANDIDARRVSPLGEPYVDFGYGGLEMEYVVHSNRVVHASFGALIGGGSVGYRNAWDVDGDHNHNYHDGFFAFEPSVNVNLNVTTWFRASLGGSYRFISGVTSGAASDNDLSGPAAALTLRFGKF